jgi:acyl carrier protein
MDEAQLRKEVVAMLVAIAPELDASALKHAEPLRRQVDLDSYDWLNFLLEVNRRFRVDIPERDYAKLATVDDLVRYLGARAP